MSTILEISPKSYKQHDFLRDPEGYFCQRCGVIIRAKIDLFQGHPFVVFESHMRERRAGEAECYGKPIEFHVIRRDKLETDL